MGPVELTAASLMWGPQCCNAARRDARQARDSRQPVIFKSHALVLLLPPLRLLLWLSLSPLLRLRASLVSVLLRQQQQAQEAVAVVAAVASGCCCCCCRGFCKAPPAREQLLRYRKAPSRAPSTLFQAKRFSRCKASASSTTGAFGGPCASGSWLGGRARQAASAEGNNSRGR